MRQRPLGSSEVQVSVVGVGCNAFGWRIDEAATRAVVDAALDSGISFFDTAESYGRGESEVFLGRALAGRRDRAVIGTKFGWGRGFGDNDIARGSAADIREAIDGSLRRLGTEYVDLYQYHRPDGFTPIEETLGTLDELVREGKVRAIGSSNFDAAGLRAAEASSQANGFARFVSAQNRYSLLEREAEDELVPACLELQVGLIPYFPLARGLLTGKYHRGEPGPAGSLMAGDLDVPDERWRAIEAFERFAEREGVGLLDVAIGGLAALPAVASVIAGATRPEQVRANAAAGNWEPAPAALAELRSL
jgi:aryl-alcohol dehydrogenase-like predicted oxidoreductase